MTKNEKGFTVPDGITADAYIGRYDNILLIKRKNEPFKDFWAMPGGFCEPYESLFDCCIRELKEEISADLTNYTSRQPKKVSSKYGRDPRGWIVNNTFEVNLADMSLETIHKFKPADDAADMKWFSIDKVLIGEVDMAFDHREIISYIYSVI